MISDRITSDPNICGGEYCIKGTRIPVSIIMSHLAAGESYEEILKNFPSITIEDIYACLDFAQYTTSEKVVVL